jgi:hypothetical protein
MFDLEMEEHKYIQLLALTGALGQFNSLIKQGHWKVTDVVKQYRISRLYSLTYCC